MPDVLDGFDVSAAVDRMLGQPALWQQALALFVDHFADWEACWHEAGDDLIQERKQVHALRSAAANVGAIRLASRAADLELAVTSVLKGEPAHGLDALRQLLLDEFKGTWKTASAALVSLAHDTGGSV